MRSSQTLACNESRMGGEVHRMPVRDYDLGQTLQSGQAFRWNRVEDGWEGVIGSRWVRLRERADHLQAQAWPRPADWTWLHDYLQVELDFAGVLRTFPQDEPMQRSVRACRGLRLLRQDPWECLASFILSSTKQIVQIRQIVEFLCQRFGERIIVPGWGREVFAFPTPERLAQCSERALRDCRMGFRAPRLLDVSRRVAAGELDLAQVGRMSCDAARERLLTCPGVGRKIADCVLLFAYGFQEAFPVDVWVARALRTLYFPRRRPDPKRLARFVATHFGPHAGFAQQYLFHYMRHQDDVAGATRRQESK